MTLRPEIAAYYALGLEKLPIEGPGSQVRGFAEAWADPGLREGILQAVRLVEREPGLAGISPHLMLIAERP